MVNIDDWSIDLGKGLGETLLDQEMKIEEKKIICSVCGKEIEDTRIEKETKAFIFTSKHNFIKFIVPIICPYCNGSTKI